MHSMIRDHSRSAAAHACEVRLVSLSGSHCEEFSLMHCRVQSSCVRLESDRG